MRNGFDYIARFFEGSLKAVEEHNPGVKGTFDRIDSRRFSAVLYKHGKAVSECSIRLEGMGRRSDGIAFSYDASARQGSYNEMLHVETNAQALFFRALGMQMGGGTRDAQPVTRGRCGVFVGLVDFPTARVAAGQWPVVDADHGVTAGQPDAVGSLPPERLDFKEFTDLPLRGL